MRTFRVCQNSECSDFKNHNEKFKKCPSCFGEITVTTLEEQRCFVSKFTREHKNIIIALASIVTGGVATLNQHSTSQDLLFFIIFAFLTVVIILKVEDIYLSTKDYEYNFDPYGYKYLTVLIIPILAIFTIIYVL